jgi:hypothetical protein
VRGGALWVRSAQAQTCSAPAGGRGKERCAHEPRAGRTHTPLRPPATRRGIERCSLERTTEGRSTCEHADEQRVIAQGRGTDVPPSGRYRRAAQACALATRLWRTRSFRSGVGCTQSCYYIRDTWGSGTLRGRSEIRMRETHEIIRYAGHSIVESVKSPQGAGCTPGRGPRPAMYPHQRECVVSQRVLARGTRTGGEALARAIVVHQ